MNDLSERENAARSDVRDSSLAASGRLEAGIRNNAPDADGWIHRLPEWEREELPRAAGWRGRIRASLRSDRFVTSAAMLAVLWSAYFVLRTTSAVVYDTAIVYALPRLFLTIFGFGTTLLLSFVVQRTERTLGFRTAVLLTILAIVAGAWLFTVVNQETQFWVYAPDRERMIKATPSQLRIEFWHTYNLHAFMYMAWGCLHFLVRYLVSLEQQRQATFRAEALAQEAKLEVLRYQLNPHFLFNTLNAISTLVLQRENRRAEETIDRLSTFLRHTLASNPREQVTLARELEAIDLYLQIQKVRFSRRMAYDFSVTAEAGRCRVPSLILQPVVENAVKYAVAPQQEGGRVEIAARCEGADLVIEVCDTGPGVVDPARISIKGTGVGLANCRARLREFYGPAAGLTLHNRETRGLCVRITLPYREIQDDDD